MKSASFALHMLKTKNNLLKICIHTGHCVRTMLTFQILHASHFVCQIDWMDTAVSIGQYLHQYNCIYFEHNGITLGHCMYDNTLVHCCFSFKSFWQTKWLMNLLFDCIQSLLKSCNRSDSNKNGRSEDSYMKQHGSKIT